jgi:methyl-accepting chemotaxis protein
MARGEDKNMYGDSISENVLVKRSLAKERLTTTTTQTGVLAPTVIVEALVPIVKSGVALGAVIEQSVMDNAFLDGMKKSTGMEVSLYSQNILSATTYIAADGFTRPIGTKLNLNNVKQMQTGSINMYSQSYFVAQVPLFDIDNNIIGVLLTGEPESAALSSVSISIELSFWVIIFMIVVSMPISIILSRNIAEQVRES